MTRSSIATLTLLVSLCALATPGCSSDASPDTGGSGGSSTHSTAGTTSTAGTGVLNTGGSANPTGGSPSTTAGAAGAATGGAAGTASGGSAAAGGGAGGSSAGSGGSATAGAPSGGAGAGGGGSTPGCPEKIDSKVACTQVVTCNDATCGVFKLGAKDCSCAAASGTFMCTSCDYAGRTEEIVVPPASALPACAADDTTLEKNTPNCTKGMRCKSLDMTKSRFCACWDDPIDGGTVWDCDAMPSNWPK